MEGSILFALDDSVHFQDKTNDVLSVGELLVDMIAADYDEQLSSNAYHRYFGGSPSNIAMNVKKLGIRSVVASAVGDDALGRFLVRHLAEAGIDTGNVQTVRSSTSMVVVSRSQSTPVPIFYRGADYELAYTAALEETLIRSRIVHFSCWPISMYPSRETIERVIETAARHQVLIGFDPNYHPMIWQQGEDGIAYVKSIIGKVDIVKPSEDDAERLFGADTPERQLDKFLALGAKLVILTLGKDGALVSNGKETVRLGTMASQVVDTTGAGDAFWSGFYTGLVQGLTVREALAAGFAVSAYKLRYMGAVVDLPDLAAIKAMYGC